MDTNDLTGLAHVLDLVANMLTCFTCCAFLLRGKVSLMGLIGWVRSVPLTGRTLRGMSPYELVRLIIALDAIATVLRSEAIPLPYSSLLASFIDLLFWFGVTVLWFQAWSARWRR